MRFAYCDVDDVVSVATDTAGPMAMVIRGLSEASARRSCDSLERRLLASSPTEVTGSRAFLNAVAS